MPTADPSSAKAGLIVSLVGFVLGVLTAYAQFWLPEEVGSLANSAGTWSLAAFLLALLARNQRSAAVFGVIALVALLVGYVAGAAMRDLSTSRPLIAFWGLVAIAVGPFLGLGAHWLKTEKAVYGALGAGGISGLLVGEGIYGLVEIADSTYPPYWVVEILVGLSLLIWASARRIRRAELVALAVTVTAVTAAAFVLVFRLNLIAFFP